MRGHRRSWRNDPLAANVLLFVGGLIIIYSCYNLYVIFSDYYEGDKAYEELRDFVTDQDVTETDEGSEPERTDFFVDFDKLHAINEDVIGWIRFEQPERISYPIVIGSTNDQYLRTNLTGEYRVEGTLFADYRNARDFSNKNTIIYGHNMRNGSMFGLLKLYRNETFCEQYPYFYVYTPDGEEHIYQIYAACIVESSSQIYDVWYEDTGEYENYLEYIKETALYTKPINVSTNSKIISLSTCTNSSEEERLVVLGVLMDE